MPDASPLITTPITADLIRGALDLEKTEIGIVPHRLPPQARAQFPDPQILMAESQPSGVQIVFRSTSTVIEIECRPTKVAYVGAPHRPHGIYELVVDGTFVAQGTAPCGNTLTIDMATGSAATQPGPTSSIRYDGLRASDKLIEIWLPHNEATELIAIRTDAPIETAPASHRQQWLHHGSSISHGSNAPNPRAIWPVVASSGRGIDLLNLGLGGSALLDPFTARAMRDAAADFISVKLGINIVNTDLMRLRAFAPAVHGFLDTIREGHPDTPLLVISAIACPIHEETPGPCAPAFTDDKVQFVATGDPAGVSTGKLTLRVIRAELERIVEQRAAGDTNIHYLNGLDLYGEADLADHPLPDALHPDTATHQLIGERFARLAFGPDGPFRPSR